MYLVYHCVPYSDKRTVVYVGHVGGPLQRDSEILDPLDNVVLKNVLLWPIRSDAVVSIGAVSLKGSSGTKTIALNGNCFVLN